MDTAAQSLLTRYIEAIQSAPSHLHLTSEQDRALFKERHVEDALKLLSYIPPSLRAANLKVVDVGSGNGVPAIPLAVSVPNWHINLIESDNKKCLFLDTFIKNNLIENASAFPVRSEDFSKVHREMFDVATARALAKFPVALELVAPLVKVGGDMFIPLGGDVETQLEAGREAMKELSLEITSQDKYDPERNFILVRLKKIAATPAKYPRRPGMAAKRPL